MKIYPLQFSSFKSINNFDRIKAAGGFARANQTQSDTFQKSANTNSISFGASNFDLKKLKGLPCAYCGETMLTKHDVYDMTELKGKHLSERLGKYAALCHDNLSDTDHEAVKFVRQVAKENPSKTAAELLPVIYLRSRNKMLLKQAEIYSGVDKLALEGNLWELHEYINTLKTQDRPLPNDMTVEELSKFLIEKTYIKYRKEVINTISKMSRKTYNDDTASIWKQIQCEIQQLPSSGDDSDALLVKLISQALRRDPKGVNEILSCDDDRVALFYSNLLTAITPTAEHIKPQSQNGAGTASNFFAVHSSCNGKRSSTPFHEYVLANAEILPNVLNYLYYIKTEDISRANNINKVEYLKGICKTLKEELAPIADMGDIKDFFASLDDICLADKTSLRAPESRALRLKAAGIFEQKIKSSGSESTLRKELDELYIELLKSFTQNLHKSYSKTIKQLFQEQNVFAALAVRHSMQMDERLKLSKIDSVKVNTMLSDKYKDIYAVPLRAELERLLCSDTNDKYVDFIDKTMHDLFPYDNIGVYCLKVLANCRNENGIYSVDKIYQTLEKDVFD